MHFSGLFNVQFWLRLTLKIPFDKKTHTGVYCIQKCIFDTEPEQAPKYELEYEMQIGAGYIIGES